MSIKIALLGLVNASLIFEAGLLRLEELHNAIFIVGQSNLSEVIAVASHLKNTEFVNALKKADDEGRIGYSDLAYLNAIMVHNELCPVRPHDEKMDMVTLSAAFSVANPHIEMVWGKV